MLSSATANAWHHTRRDWFNYIEAERNWNEVKTRDGWDALWRERCLGDDTVILFFEDRGWLVGRSKKDFLRRELLDHPEAERIKPCWDLRLTYVSWRRLYDSWRNDLRRTWPDDTWNGLINKKECSRFREQNKFTRKCDDFPDWRTAEETALDEEIAKTPK